MKNMLHYTTEQLAFLRKGYRVMSLRDLTAAFAAKFGTEKTETQLRSTVRNHHIRSGRTGCFEEGHRTWNKGIKGYMGANPTSFKKGNKPANWKPLGTERINSKDGFILVKIKERDPYTCFPTRYKHKHVWLWERKNGPVPAGHVVAFRDGNKLNCKLRNLMLITRAELLRLNQYGYKEMPKELQPTVLALAKVEVKAFGRSHDKR